MTWKVADGAIRDVRGRSIVMRGVNFAGSHKIKPYLSSFGPPDLARLKSDYGFNALRMLVLWAGIEPSKGSYDEHYLDGVEERVRWAHDANMLVVLDMHQDLYGEGFLGGDGAPKWTCDEARYAAFKPTTPWFLGSLDTNVTACVDKLYEEGGESRTHFVEAWRRLATRLSKYDNIVGFDILNEPHWGTYSILAFEADKLASFYTEVATAVRKEAPTWLVFAEPGSNRNVGYPSSLPKLPFEGVVYAPHSYDRDAESGSGFDDSRRAAILDNVAKLREEANAIGAALFIGEYGERLYDGDLASLAAALPKALAARGALGVADLERGLEAARVEAKRIHATRVIIVGGGVGPTADGARLRDAMGELAKAGVERVDVLGTSALADLRLYRPLVTSAIFARDGAVIDDAPRLSPETVQARVRSRVAARVPVSVEGATWTSTAALEAASPDETRVVLARVPSTTPLRVHVGGKVHSVDASAVTAAPSPMLEHVSAVAKLDALIARGEGAGTKDAWKSEIVAIARKNKLASPFTSLIVLENDSDVARMRSREAPSAAPPPPPPSPSPSTPSAPARGHVTKAPAMRQATTTVSGRVPPEVIQRIVRQRWGALRACYEDGLRRRGDELSGRVSVKFVITRDGSVGTAMDAGSEISDKKTIDCVVDVFRHLVFPAPEGANITVVYPLMLAPITAEDEASPPPTRLPVSASTIWSPSPFRLSAGAAPPSPAEKLFPWSMNYRRVMAFVPASLGGDASPSATEPNAKAAIDAATDLRAREGSASAIALVALGQAYEAAGDKDRATRAYGSLADLYPERAEMLRAAAVRIARVRPGDPIAIDLLRRAVSERPDQPSSHHLLCLELLRAGKPEAAFEAAANGAKRRYELRYAGVSDLLASDLGLAAAAWAQAEPAKRDMIESKAIVLHARSRDRSTVQAIAAWETDTSDIDVQAFDAKGERSGATTSQALDGFGPEALDLATDVKRASPLNAVVRLQRKGTGGDVLGVVHVVRHDGKGNVTIDPRPFTLMNEGTVLDLGAL